MIFLAAFPLATGWMAPQLLPRRSLARRVGDPRRSPRAEPGALRRRPPPRPSQWGVRDEEPALQERKWKRVGVPIGRQGSHPQPGSRYARFDPGRLLPGPDEHGEPLRTSGRLAIARG